LRFEDHQLFAGQGPKPTQASTKAPSANPIAQKPAAYRPPHAKTAAVIQAQVTFTESMICHRLFFNHQYKFQQYVWHNLHIV
jgi:hypothetical protein